MVQMLWKTIWQFLKRLNIVLPTLCSPVVGSLPLSSVHGILQARILEWVSLFFSLWPSNPTPRYMWSREINTQTYTAVFTISQKWKWPKCPLADEWVNEMCHIHIMEHYLAIKRDNAHTMIWMDLANVTWKKPVTKDHMLREFIVMRCLEEANL